ncbi:DNA gyrase inhibitor YacG [uncultured Methylovirgula sp.]|uniref:DNA gyrase inhibitor YacG n=1 Tax=uncultured Methylovirgula sp. TaxID=1285960 RepID=UPI002626018F|nr:DNA gyrase inhibitor YacG [uncultured Methylovirgula sp.]
MQQKAEDQGQSRKARRCPICGKPASEAERPFCSRRCADIDLHRWLSGAYAVPVRPDDEPEDSALDEPGPEQG